MFASVCICHVISRDIVLPQATTLHLASITEFQIMLMFSNDTNGTKLYMEIY